MHVLMHVLCYGGLKTLESDERGRVVILLAHGSSPIRVRVGAGL
jgi:hypothetical protein